MISDSEHYLITHQIARGEMHFTVIKNCKNRVFYTMAGWVRAFLRFCCYFKMYAPTLPLDRMTASCPQDSCNPL